MHCNPKKTDDLFYIADVVIPSFFKHYFDIKTKTIVKDDCYIIEIEEDLDLFVDTVTVIINYLYDGIKIEANENDGKYIWKVTKK